MHDAGKVVAGLVVFLAIVTSPMWYHLVQGAGTAAPELVLPAGGGQCIKETSYMRSLHMDLLNGWRDDVVRRDDRMFKAADGKEYEKSLTNTCLDCHPKRAEFCDRCHEYAGVTPYCWDCHVEPAPIERRETR